MTAEMRVSATPLGNKVLVQLDDVEEVSEGGIIMHTTNNREREYIAQTRGTILKIGPEAWVDPETGLDFPWRSLVAEEGKKVMFAKYSGVSINGEDKLAPRIMNDLDIIAVLEDE